MKKEEMFLALATAYNEEVRVQKANRVLGHIEMADCCRYESLGILTAASALGFDEKEFITEARKLREKVDV